MFLVFVGGKAVGSLYVGVGRAVLEFCDFGSGRVFGPVFGL